MPYFTGYNLSIKLLEKDSYIESLETEVKRLKERLSMVEENLSSKEEAKDEVDKEVIKLSDELKVRELKLELLSKETQEQEIKKPSRRLVCFKMLERSIPRKDYEVYSNDTLIGIVSSGTFSIELNKFLLIHSGHHLLLGSLTPCAEIFTLC